MELGLVWKNNNFWFPHHRLLDWTPVDSKLTENKNLVLDILQKDNWLTLIDSECSMKNDTLLWTKENLVHSILDLEQIWFKVTPNNWYNIEITKLIKTEKVNITSIIMKLDFVEEKKETA